MHQSASVFSEAVCACTRVHLCEFSEAHICACTRVHLCSVRHTRLYQSASVFSEAHKAVCGCTRVHQAHKAVCGCTRVHQAHKAVCACTRVHLCSVRLYVHAPECICVQ